MSDSSVSKTDLFYLIPECASITRDKGFDVSQLLKQLLLMGTEIGEALEEVECELDQTDYELWLRVQDFIGAMREFEEYRHDEPGLEISYIPEEKLRAFIEEMVDTFIRICSFVGGNGWLGLFIKVLHQKMDKNRGRPTKHGKQF